MDFETYTAEFDRILGSPEPPAPYNNPDYFNYTKLNASRMRRWLKTAVLSDELVNAVKEIVAPQQWIVITEPWCGDAAHIVPFFHLIAQTNPLIAVDYELRDTEPFRINEYLTRGGKAIPKLIIRDAAGNDLATWGPRPEACQQLFDELKARQVDFETLKTALQNWYNADGGKAIQEELTTLLTTGK
jgi:hypothetical protein